MNAFDSLFHIRHEKRLMEGVQRGGQEVLYRFYIFNPPVNEDLGKDCRDRGFS
jgi:hypothetical protein